MALRTEGREGRSFASAFELYGSAREGRLMLNGRGYSSAEVERVELR